MEKVSSSAAVVEKPKSFIAQLKDHRKEQRKLLKQKEEDRISYDLAKYGLGDLYSSDHQSISDAVAFIKNYMMENSEANTFTFNFSNLLNVVVMIDITNRGSGIVNVIDNFPFWPSTILLNLPRETIKAFMYKVMHNISNAFADGYEFDIQRGNLGHDSETAIFFAIK